MFLPTSHALCILAVVSCSVGASCVASSQSSYHAQLRAYEASESHARARDESVWRGAELDRGALLRAVLDRNPSVEAARQAWRAALFRYRQADAYDDPVLMASIAPLSLSAANTRFGYELGISQRLALGGKLDAQAELAIAQARAAESDYADTRLRLALVASELYADYFVAVRSLEIQKQHVALMDELEHNARAAYESGHASAQDALQAQSELARLEYQSTVYETQRQVAIAQINALLHRAPDAPLPAPAAELPPRDEPAPAPKQLDELLEQRPDVRAVRARVQVGQARTSVARSEYYPDLTVSTTYNSMWDMPQHRWMAGVSLNVPLQRARRQAAVDEASAMRAASESELRGALDGARTEVAVARRRITEAEHAATLFAERLVPLARARIDAARAGYIASQNAFMVVIEAEHALHAAELELQMARGDLDKRRAELERALGRIAGLEPRGAQP